MKKVRKGWSHGSLIGGAAMSKKCMERIVNSETASEPAKRTATEILTKLEDLDGFLRARRD